MDFMHWMSRQTGQWAQIELPSILQNLLNKSFVRLYGVNEAEMEKPAEQYSSLSQLFQRQLKAGVRRIANSRVVHPVDAVIRSAGVIDENLEFEVKGHRVGLSELVGANYEAEKFIGGQSIVYYLAPQHYHGVHSPISGEIVNVTHVPGSLWPVNEWGWRWGGNVLVRNERLVIEMKWQDKALLLVLVGALNVGHIRVTMDERVQKNCRKDSMTSFHYEPARKVSKAENLAFFELGSSVVLICERGVLSSLPSHWGGKQMILGEGIEIEFNS